MRTIPKRVLRRSKVSNTRDFKQAKRLQIKQVIKTLKELNEGSAYTPEGYNIPIMLGIAKRMRVAWSVKKWGR